MPKLSPEGTRTLDNVMGSALPAAAPNPQARHPEERATMPSGANPPPTKQMIRAPLRAASPAPQSMGALADRMHPTKRR